MSELKTGPLANIEEIAVANQDVIQLKTLDNLLKCGICYEYFETCVITDCCHNFCSLCIRKYIQFKNECPVCFKQLYDGNLKANRIVDNFVEIFPSLKDRLIRCIRTIKTLKSDTIYISPSKKVVEAKTPKTRKNDDVGPPIPKSHSSSVVSADNEITVTHSSPQQKMIIPKIFQSPTRKSSPNDGKTVKMVECPVCAVPVSEANINRHLDDCLIRRKESANKKNSSTAQKRAHLPKLVYRLMSTTQLRKKAMEYGLSSLGDTDTLKNRIQKYTAVYNAECDKTNPRPVTDLLRLVEKEEKTLANQKLPKSKLSLPPDDVTCKAELNVHYLKENKKSFQNLIDEVKNRRTSKSTDIDPETSNVSFLENSESRNYYCQPSTSSFNFDPTFALQNDDMLEIHEPKIETSEESLNGSITNLKTEPSNFEPEEEDEEVGSNVLKRRRLSSKRLNFDDQFDVPPIKLEPEIDIYEAPTDDEAEDIKDSVSPVMKRRTRRTNKQHLHEEGPVKKDLRKRKR